MSTVIANQGSHAFAPKKGKERAPIPPSPECAPESTASNIRSLREFKDGLAVRSAQETDLAWIHGLMLRSFPREECAGEEQLSAWFRHHASRAYILLAVEPGAGPERIGFFLGSQLDGFFFGEYMAMDPSVRNKGYGRRFLVRLKEIFQQPVLFECELPEASEIARRRYQFYQRLGFFRYRFNYAMPALHKGDKPVPMCLMGGAEKIEPEKLDAVVREVYCRVYPHVIRLKENENLIETA